MNHYITSHEAEKLSRAVYPLPEFIEEAIQKNNVADQYRARPAYQKNDYIGWILRAKRTETRQKRLQQMIDELKEGQHYMNMLYQSFS